MELTTLTQPPWLYVLIAVAVVVIGLIVAGAVAASRRQSERERLRERYGAEYERTLAMHRSTRAAVADLKERERQHDDLELNELNDADRDLVRRHMAALQFRFVEDPADVMLETERVVTEVLRAKGYPVTDDREQGLRLFSVDHPGEAGAMRTVLEQDHGGDIGQMRRAFLDARRAIASSVGVGYDLGDATAATEAADRPDDLRVEHHDRHPLPAGETTT